MVSEGCFVHKERGNSTHFSEFGHYCNIVHARTEYCDLTVKLWTCIQEVCDLNLDWVTDHPD